MPSLVGNKPNQVPSNGDLGTLAFQDSNAVNIQGGTAVIDNLTADSINLKVDSDLTNISPSLLLDFANTKALDPRITFTRASTASFYDGVTTAKAEENLVIRSEELDNAAWSKFNITATANSTASPDGAITAELIAETTASSTHTLFRNFATTSGLSYTTSVFVKKGTGATAPDIFQISFGSDGHGVSQYANFDISVGGGASGTVTSSTGGTAVITLVGSGWYRCVWTATATATATTAAVVFAFANNNPTATRFPSYTGATTSDIFLWGAQVEQRSAVSAYTPTTTAPITNYIPALRTAQAGQARFDHAPLTGESLGLLIEEQRTNLFTYSSEFDNAIWIKNGGTILANTVIAPDGTLNADKVLPISGSNTVYEVISVTSGTSYTFSVYAKMAGNRYVVMRNTFAGLSADNLSFDLLDGVVQRNVSGVTATITPVGNGWYRCSSSWSAGATGASNFQIKTGSEAVATTSSTLAGSYNGFDGIYIWGAQLEAGAFATSYIPTVASQVTRSADAASMTGLNFSSWYRADEGTFFANSKKNSAVATTVNPIMYADDGASDRVVLQYITTPAIEGAVVALGTTQASLTFLSTYTTDNATAMSYKVNDFAAANNGGTVGTDTSGILPNINALRIGHRTLISAQYLNGTIKKLAYYPVRLPNAELQEMTS
jgi:hypothetical protein